MGGSASRNNGSIVGGSTSRNIQALQKQLDRERRINAANEKLNELSKFLSKQDLKFKLELKELKKRFSKIDDFSTTDDGIQDNDFDNQIVYRKPLPEDSEENLIKGTWIIKTGEGEDGSPPSEMPEFIPKRDGEDFAVKAGAKKKISSQPRKQKQGLKVLFSKA